MAFQEYYIQRTCSQERIANANVAQIDGKYNLLLIHVNDVCYTINPELKKILDAKEDSIEEKILIECGSVPDYLKPIKTYTDFDFPFEFKGSKYILTGQEATACLAQFYRFMLAYLHNETVEISIPFGAVDYTKLETEGGNEEFDNILYFGLITFYFESAVKKRKSAALYFDGTLIDLIGDIPKTILKFYSTTEKFLVFVKD